jgi:tRNA 2-thiouridine synthesizing protein A
MGCGELLVLLKLRFRELPDGTRFELVSRDPGSVEDLPSWSRMTGHALLRVEHPHYSFRVTHR